MFKRPIMDLSPPPYPSIHPNLKQLHALNFDFLHALQVVQRSESRSSHHSLRLSELTAKPLLTCDQTALQRIASCSFSLFSLQWHRIDEWTQLAEHSAATRSKMSSKLDTQAPPDEATALVLHFMQCAVFFGWHLAQHEEQTARFMLGMSPETATVVRTLDLWQCRYISQHHRKLLAPRWLHNRYFWPDLLHYGRSGEPEHLKLVQLLGTQLMAQDLEPSAIARHTIADND